LADAIGADMSNVEDMILGDEKFDQIDNFFQVNGRKLLMFFYQEMKVTKLHEKKSISNPLSALLKPVFFQNKG
jgi:hypothetical protein